MKRSMSWRASAIPAGIGLMALLMVISVLRTREWRVIAGTLIVTGVNDVPDTEAARLLGEVCRALLIAQRVPRDARTAIVPGKKVDAGALGEYIAAPDKK